jgi:hypothetical protein
MSKFKSSANKNVLKLFAIFLVAMIFIIPLMYLTLFRSIDTAYGSKMIAHKIGSAESIAGSDPYEIIRSYVQNSLRKDMTRADVFAVLNKIGPFTSSSEVLLDGNTQETIVFQVCYQAFNNPIFYIVFTPAGTFLDTVFSDS